MFRNATVSTHARDVFPTRRFSVDGFKQDDTYAAFWSLGSSEELIFEMRRELRVKAVARSIVLGGFALISSGRRGRRGNDHWARRLFPSPWLPARKCVVLLLRIQSNWTKRANPSSIKTTSSAARLWCCLFLGEIRAKSDLFCVTKKKKKRIISFSH